MSRENRTSVMVNSPVPGIRGQNGDSHDSDSDRDSVTGEWCTVTSSNERRRVKRARTNTGDTNLSTDQKLDLILKNQASHDSRIASLQNKLESALKLSSKIPAIEQSLNFMECKQKYHDYKSLDLEARGRRHNLLFKGFPEERSENCLTKITELMRFKLGIKHMAPIDRVHRLGKYRRDFARSIIVRFAFQCDAETVLSAARNLKGTRYSISRDFPPEIADARLWPTYKDIRDKYDQDVVKMGFPAKITRNGVVLVDLFPEWNAILNKPRIHPDRFSKPISECRSKLQLDESSSRRQNPTTRTYAAVTSGTSASDHPYDDNESVSALFTNASSTCVNSPVAHAVHGSPRSQPPPPTADRSSAPAIDIEVEAGSIHTPISDMYTPVRDRMTQMQNTSKSHNSKSNA